MLQDIIRFFTQFAVARPALQFHDQRAVLADGKETEQKAESIDIPKETYAVEPKVEEPKAETEKPVEEKHSENKTEKKNFNYKKNYKK